MKEQVLKHTKASGVPLKVEDQTAIAHVVQLLSSVSALEGMQSL